MEHRIDIGIDGGGTGCRVVVCRGDRSARASGGPANVISDPAAAEAAIRLALTEALHGVGLGLDDLDEARIVAGLAGCRLPGAADAFAIRLPWLAYVVDDSVTALEGAFGGAEGTLVNLGTGSFFIRRDGRGTTHQGGWGLNLGDEGSAAWLGREALRDMVRIEDGRLPDFAGDPLIAVLRKACGRHPVRFADRATPAGYAALAPLIVEADTALAAALVDRVIACVRTGLAAIGHPAGARWALSGGLGAALTDRFEPADWASGRVAPEGSALDGALAMARGLP